MKIFSILFLFFPHILLAQQRYSDAASERLVEIHEQYDRESNRIPNVQMQWTLMNGSKEEKRAVSFLKMHSNNRVGYKTYITKAEEETLKVPAHEKWYILIKDIPQGENIELYTKKGSLAIKAIPASNNSILLWNVKDSSLNKILIQKYLEILPGARINLAAGTKVRIVYQN